MNTVGSSIILSSYTAMKWPYRTNDIRKNDINGKSLALGQFLNLQIPELHSRCPVMRLQCNKTGVLAGAGIYVHNLPV
jgi:hypothetical protein